MNYILDSSKQSKTDYISLLKIQIHFTRMQIQYFYNITRTNRYEQITKAAFRLNFETQKSYFSNLTQSPAERKPHEQKSDSYRSNAYPELAMASRTEPVGCEPPEPPGVALGVMSSFLKSSFVSRCEAGVCSTLLSSILTCFL